MQNYTNTDSWEDTSAIWYSRDVGGQSVADVESWRAMLNAHSRTSAITGNETSVSQSLPSCCSCRCRCCKLSDAHAACGCSEHQTHTPRLVWLHGVLGDAHITKTLRWSMLSCWFHPSIPPPTTLIDCCLLRSFVCQLWCRILKSTLCCLRLWACWCAVVIDDSYFQLLGRSYRVL